MPLEWLSKLNFFSFILYMKGGDPAARSRTATLLRLSANHEIHRDSTYMELRALPTFSA